jgi:hypothetical protein
MQKDPLAELIKRRHPLYEAMLEHWDFVESTYEGGKAWFADNIFRYLKEGDKEYADRVERAYRFNHTKQVVDLVDKYIFKMPVARKADAPDYIKRFWKSATLNGLDIEAFMKRVSSMSSQFGRPWIVVDSTAGGEEAVTVADEQAGLARVYAYLVRPQDMLDMSYDELGQLRWALVREVVRDDEDPMESSGSFINRYRLWTREDWTLFEERQERGKTKVVEIDYGVHGLDVVPIISADHIFTEERYVAPGLIDDIAYLDRANANYLSNLDAIIQDQTFSSLAMPAQNIIPGEDGYDKVVEMGTKRVFLYNGEGGKEPKYLSPDPRQAQLILEAIGKIINEIYHSVGLSAERTKDDNGKGIDNASGAAKAYDFERVNTLLVSKATSLELIERALLGLVAAWNGEKLPKEEQVAYSRDFDIRSLYDEFEIAARLSLLMAPDEVRREQMRSVIKKLFPMASGELAKKLEAALKDWPPEPVMEEEGGLGSTPKKSAGSKLKAASTQKTAKELAA